MKSVAFLVDEEIHRDFKISCAMKGIDMKNRIIELMKQDSKETKEQK